MKIKKYWIAVQTEQSGKYDAFIIPVTECDNILFVLKERAIRGIVCANIFDTQKAATQTISAWRDGFRAAGVYKWDTMPDGSPAPF